MADKIKCLSDEDFDAYMDFIYRSCGDESILGTSLHALYFA